MYQERLVWKSLAPYGFSNYEVSETGLLKNITSGYITKGSIKKRNGRYSSTLSDDKGVFHSLNTNKLICLGFHGFPPTPQHTCDHIDRNKINNNASNLRWATKTEQQENRNKWKKCNTGKAITQICSDGFEIFTWLMPSFAAETYKFDYGDMIKACKSGELYQGFYWKYARDPLPGELWMQVLSEDFNYKVWGSNKGRIFTDSLNGRLTYGTISNKCRHVSIKHKDGIYHSYLVHRLIMWGFHGPDPREVNHKNGNSMINLLENLEYMTGKENSNHAVETGLVVRPLNNHTSKRYVQMDMNNLYINEFPSAHEAERQTGIDNRRVSEVANGRKKSHKQFKWAHKDNYRHIGYSPLYKGQQQMEYSVAEIKQKEMEQYMAETKIQQIEPYSVETLEMFKTLLG